MVEISLLFPVVLLGMGVLIGIPCHVWRRFHPRWGDSERGDLVVTLLLAAFLASTCCGLLWAIPEMIHHPDQAGAVLGNFGFVYGTIPLTFAGAALAGYLVKRFVPRVAP